MKALLIFEQFIERVFLARITVTGREYFRARLLIKFILLCVVFATGYFVNTFFTGALAVRMGMVIAVVFFAFLCYGLGRVSDPKWISRFFILGVWLTLFLLVLFSRGIHSSVMPWLTLVPVMALLLRGRRSSLAWFVICIATVLGYYYTDGRYVISSRWTTPPSDLFTASLYIGLVSCILAVTYIFHGQGVRLLATIRDQQAMIEKQSAEIEARNETLEAEVERRTQELLDYNQQLEQFAFIASHNLRAPVASLLGLGHVLEMSSGNQDDVNKICENMISTARELDRVVRDLSTILETRQASHAPLMEMDLQEEVQLVRVSLERELVNTGTMLETDFKEVPVIQTVRPLMDSILMNLISNAIKYRHPDRQPSVRLTTRREDGEVCLSVADNGLGMDLGKYGDKLFTLYGRFHSHVDGKGLGLYLVKTHVMAMGGRVEVDSEIGIGTTFRVYFRANGKAG
jgi:signal transduction histidine kinase